ncbi:putative disease resistance protein RGA1 [Impatiens glandulifera]|uniref:putative disease resistance protein RGA1 n=1 Tax=Impatiens glandulifera TaxID=253017 RepID=UPI001FB083B0|nr:putative disease resistance protein RGA1 [Impatiens glandulifera]
MVDAALISGLLSNLAPLIQDEFSLFWSFKEEVQKLSSTLSSISAVLEDAERKNVQERDKKTEDWLRKLKDVAYEVRDIMDDCTFEDLCLQVNRRNASSSTLIQVTNSITRPFSIPMTRLKVGHKIKDVQKKLDQISLERQKLHLLESVPDSKIDKLTSSSRETISLSSCNQVYGRDEEKKQIIDFLVNSSSAKKLSVLPIVGSGGLGKTTFVQTVFNDEEITKHFETKIWVCVSNEFDIKLVMKAILGEKAGARLEELQRKVREKLSGKRYLIVLDDVWNENVVTWDQLRSILDCGSNGAFVLATTRKHIVARIMRTNQHFELSHLSHEDCWLLFEERAFMCGTPKTPNFVHIGIEIAKKCKGIPLIAKTLGNQLGFKSDEIEWCKIRDSEIWEIPQESEVLFYILKLGYYDLPYHLRRCFLFCAIFPNNAEIEKERLIQLWMAHGLIPIVENQEMEDIGNTIWKELCCRSFFQDEKLNCFGKEICKMHDIMHDLAQSIMEGECYTLEDYNSSDGLRREVCHLTVMDDEFLKKSVGSLKTIEGLQSLMLNGIDVDGNLMFLSVLKELQTLRVLELSCHVLYQDDYLSEIFNSKNESKKYQDLRYLGCLKHLRYLDISGNDHITTLPNSICDLLNLQTLKLNECYNLKSLPRNTKNLISLRHLHLENCNELKYMPRGMGQLKHLKTLSLFVISNKERDGQLHELIELDIGRSLKLKNLGRVSNASMKRGISMAKKTSINELKLEWTSDDEDYEVDDNESKSIRDEKIVEGLEVSTARLKILIMRGYKGVNPPVLKGNQFPLLERLVIDRMKNLRGLVSPSCWSTGAFPNLSTLAISYCPKLGALPPHLKSLKHVTLVGECSDELLYSITNLNGTLTYLNLSELNNDVEHGIFTVNNNMNGIEVELFPLLKELKIGGMRNLRELLSPTIPSVRAFPNLCTLLIRDCPNLGALPPNLNSLKDVTVWVECSNELLYSISNLSSLTHLTLIGLGERSVLFGVRSAFPSLRFLSIDRCPKLRRLFDEGMIMQETLKNHLQGQTERTRGHISSLTELISSNNCQNRDLMNFLTELICNTKISDCQTKDFINSLTELDIRNCPELTISVEEFRNLNINDSLQRLYIRRCPKLVSSEEADEFRALLLSLRNSLLGSENGSENDSENGSENGTRQPVPEKVYVDKFNVDIIF